jgi:hypothetical protein
MKLRPLTHHQLHLSLLDQTPVLLPDGQEQELAQALMELLLQAAASEHLTEAEALGGGDEPEAHE